MNFTLESQSKLMELLNKKIMELVAEKNIEFETVLFCLLVTSREVIKKMIVPELKNIEEKDAFSSITKKLDEALEIHLNL